MNFAFKMIIRYKFEAEIQNARVLIIVLCHQVSYLHNNIIVIKSIDLSIALSRLVVDRLLK